MVIPERRDELCILTEVHKYKVPLFGLLFSSPDCRKASSVIKVHAHWVVPSSALKELQVSFLSFIIIITTRLRSN
ncbi:hypothetical protein PM082_003074 [Marasmius tenuissimus]|nr:hypothetical protein PM082_003074 [Marasmius tenuissimus]